MEMLSNIWAIIIAVFPLILKEPLSVTRELLPSIPMIPTLGKLCAICLMKEERRVWSSRYAKKLLKSHRGLSGLSADWVICRSIERNGLKLSRVFNMPYEGIQHVLICGKLWALLISD